MKITKDKITNINASSTNKMSTSIYKSGKQSEIQNQTDFTLKLQQSLKNCEKNVSAGAIDHHIHHSLCNATYSRCVLILQIL